MKFVAMLHAVQNKEQAFMTEAAQAPKVEHEKLTAVKNCGRSESLVKGQPANETCDKSGNLWRTG
jgi:hypothetical protein